MTDYPRTAGWPERTWRNINGPDIARGYLPGARPYVLYGERLLVGASDEIPVWENGMPSTFVPPNNAELTISASSFSDYGKNVRLMYLDSTLVERSVIVTLAATPPVVTGVYAVDTMYSLNGALVGSVTATHDGVTHALIPAGSIKFDTAIRRVPAGKRLMVSAMYGGATSGTSAAKVHIELVASFFNGDSFAAQAYLVTYAAIALQDSTVTLPLPNPLAIPAGEWFGFVASSDKGADVTAGLFGWLENA